MILSAAVNHYVTKNRRNQAVKKYGFANCIRIGKILLAQFPARLKGVLNYVRVPSQSTDTATAVPSSYSS
jgi:hypothetical protein